MGSDDDPDALTDEDGDPNVMDVETIYDEIADSYGADAFEGSDPYHADLEFPTTTDLIPDVDGARVLDAGCGSGPYAAWLLERGADVVGIDLSEAMIEEARDRLGDRATFRQWDLTEALTFADDEEFQGVVSGQVLGHIGDWSGPFEEFARVLEPGGFLVFSVRHPVRNAMTAEDWTYYEVERHVMDWGIDTPHYPRPFSAIVSPLVDAGFRLDEVTAPEPTERFREQLPEEYEDLSKRPHFICVRAFLE